MLLLLLLLLLCGGSVVLLPERNIVIICWCCCCRCVSDSMASLRMPVAAAAAIPSSCVSMQASSSVWQLGQRRFAGVMAGAVNVAAAAARVGLLVKQHCVA
jgi:hypothetical protein